MNRIRKGDQVIVTTGNKKIKGQTGEVLRVDRFGNLITNIDRRTFEKLASQASTSGLTIRIGERLVSIKELREGDVVTVELDESNPMKFARNITVGVRLAARIGFAVGVGLAG